MARIYGAHIDAGPCPSCGASSCRAMGYISPPVCGSCFVYLAYTDELRLRLMTNAEWAALSNQQRVELTNFRDFIRQREALLR